MKKKVLSLVLSASMVSSMLPAMAYAADGTTTFPDMPNDWSTTALQSAIDNGLLNGIDGKIAASENLTRAQMAAIVTRAFGTNGNADISGFGDVNSGDWFYNAMAAAVNMGAFQGDGTGLNPNANITRQEAFTVLARLFTLSGADQSVLNSFSDAGQVADWAKDSMASMVQAGYVSGDRNMLKPTSSITRAEFAQVMYNLLSDYMVAGEDGTNVQGNAILNQTGTLSNVTVSGDLIVGDGAGEGDVTLNNVTVSGRLLVRGGGVNTVTLEGNTTVGGQIVVNKPTGDVRVHNSTSNEFDAAVISDGATLTGEFDVVEVTASGTTTVTGATVNTVNVSAAASLSVTGESKVDTVNLDAASSKLNVNGNSTVTTVNVPESASNASIDVANGSTVTNVNTAANGVSIDGEGKVSNVKVEGNNTSVDTVGTKVTVASGVTGTTSNGKDIAAGTTVTTTANGTTGGGSTGGSTGGDSGDDNPVVDENPADAKVATLDDQDTPELDTGLIENYAVTSKTGSEIGTATVYDVTVTGSHLLKHKAADSQGEGYWAGIQVPFAEGDKYAYGKGETYTADTEAVYQNLDASEIIDGYVSFYLDTAQYDKAYIAVQHTEGETTTVTVYNVDYSGVEKAPTVENAKAWVVYDESTYNQLPEEYVTEYPYKDFKDSLELPWLVVTYDRNITGTVNFSVTKDNNPVTIGHGSSLEVDSKGDTKYMIWHLGTPPVTGDKDYLNQSAGSLSGNYAVTVSMDDTGVAVTSATASTELYKENSDAEEVTITFTDAETGTVYQELTVVSGATVAAPADPTKEGFVFDGWYKDNEYKEEWTSTTITENTTVYAKWTAIKSSAFSQINSVAAMTEEQWTASGGASLEKAPTFDKMVVDYAVNGTAITATGNLPYVSGFVGFNSTVPAEQEGHYATVHIPVTADEYALAKAATGTVFTLGDKEFTAKNMEGAILTHDTYSIDLLFHISDGQTPFTLTVDWDGDGAEYTATTYTIDYSDVTLEANPAIATVSTLEGLNAQLAEDEVTTINVTGEGFNIPTGQESVVIPEGKTVNVQEGVTLTIGTASEVATLAEGDTLTVEGTLSVSGKVEVLAGAKVTNNGAVTVAKNATLTNNGTVAVAENATLTNNGTLINNSTMTVADTAKVDGSGTVDGTETGDLNTMNLLKTALAYDYSESGNPYAYHTDAVISVTEEGVVVSYAGKAEDFLKAKEPDTDDAPTNATADLARFLGALYRMDNGTSVTSLKYGEDTYTWNNESTRKGSNWEKDGNGATLVGALVGQISKDMQIDGSSEPETDAQSSFEITIGDVPVTFNITVAAQA